MSGLELMTAVRERLRLTVIVFVDGAYGLIRYQQLAATGRTFATEIAPPDVAALADAVGARHVRLDGNAATVLREAIGSDIVTIVEVVVGDTLPMQVMRAKAIARGVAGPRARSWLKRLRRRR
jgi:acetolactate synthase-1/2/3 large subunit